MTSDWEGRGRLFGGSGIQDKGGGASREKVPRKSSSGPGNSVDRKPWAGPSWPCPRVSGGQEERERLRREAEEAAPGLAQERPVQMDFIPHAMEAN